ncbi:MAG: hypothetical protein QNL04_09830 [SAR324 cluster bacterium]|nr:hypothetical protein [SAR324 cluster bacterium]
MKNKKRYNKILRGALATSICFIRLFFVASREKPKKEPAKSVQEKPAKK